jgi:DNA-binding GntR family transcriptional regulator
LHAKEAEVSERHGSRTQAAADKLRQMIVAGEFVPGQRISEREVGAKIAGLTRTPLREAFKILAAEGLVTISPNRGASVVMLSVAEVGDAIEVLIGLEAIAAETACERIDEMEIAVLEELHRRMYEAWVARRLMDYFELNQEIHQRIVDAAQNRALSRIYAAECARIRRYRYAGNQSEQRWQRAIAEHEQIMRVLKDRNGALLRETLRAHHESGWRVARELVAREFAGSPAAG